MKTDRRTAMESALKDIVVPELRRAGFTGSFPHFRRVRDTVDLVTFPKFNLLSLCLAGRLTTSSRADGDSHDQDLPGERRRPPLPLLERV